MLCGVPIALLAGCALDSEPATSQVASNSTVADYTSSGCSTSVVIGLSRQISDEIACEHPGGLTSFTPSGNLTVTNNSVLPYLAAGAKTDLIAEAASHSVQVNSAFRTIAQQYLLYRWYVNGRCGISAAATVGNSNHESGRAVDLANWSSVVTSMSAHGWKHDVPGDSVHFDHTSSPDIRGQDVMAFQKLWNRNHPADRIAEDGSYGPQTESRLKQSPATGFAIGASCTTQHAEVADVVSIDGPDSAPPATRTHFTLTIQNNGTTDWPGTAVLVAPANTQLHDDSWIDATQIATLGSDIVAGSMGEIAFDVMTPTTSDEMAVFEPLTLTDGTTTLGQVNLAVTVVPAAQGGGASDGSGTTGAPQSGDGGDTHDEYNQDITAGCNAGGTSGAGALVLALGLVLRRRRR
ncbi:MAG: M15 family metallopeptidase [Deltaproteobacteria bacterium]|nr:M15 family metallopeptidase [Deltaproteobacteria bacterium]